MKISTKSRYGLRMLIDLCKHEKEVPVTLASIANRQEISVNYLEQVASDLKRSGFIYAIKGVNGGYFLAKDASEIIIGDVLRVLEGDIRLTDDFVLEETVLQKTIRESVYDVLNERIAALVDTTTLKDFIGE